MDRLQFWVSFLPEDERALRQDGIHFCNISYWSDALAADVGRSKDKLLIKYDPRDLSRIFVRRSSGRFVEARYRNLSWPAITMAEQKAAVRQLKAQGRREINETMIFTTTMRQREIEDTARRQTASTRRRREQRPSSLSADKKGGSLKGGGRPIRAKTYASVLHAMLKVGLALVASDQAMTGSGARLGAAAGRLEVAAARDDVRVGERRDAGQVLVAAPAVRRHVAASTIRVICTVFQISTALESRLRQLALFMTSS